MRFWTKYLPVRKRYSLIVALQCLVIFSFVSACDVAVPVPLVTRTASAPTLEATDDPFPAPPSEIPSNFIDTLGSSNPTAAGLPNDLAVPPIAIGTPNPITGVTRVQLTLRDGMLLTGDLTANVESRSAGVVLLSDRVGAWTDFDLVLSREGFVVLDVTISRFDDPADLLDIINSFSDLAEGDTALLDPGRIAVIGEQNGAELALRGCIQDFRCDGLAILSPVSSALPPLGGLMGERPMWIAVGTADPQSFSISQAIAAGALNVSLVTTETNSRGGDLLMDMSVQNPFLVWLRSVVG